MSVLNTGMDTTQIVRIARARFNHQQAKTQLQEKYTAKLNVAFGGGMWIITPELLSYLRSAPPVTIMTDSFNTPLQIDTVAMLKHVEPIYHTTMGEWFNEYERLKSNR